MSLRNNRVIYKSGSTFTDLSVNLSNPVSGIETVQITAATDALYLGSDLPFNHRFIDINHSNTSDSSVSVSIWDGSQWIACVDVIDETKEGLHTFHNAGILSWVPNRYSGSWNRTDNTENMSDLADFSIYDMYWVKLTFSGNFSANSSIKYIGHKFSTDSDLFVQYPDLSSTELMEAFATGKADWHDQAYIAAEYIIQDLRERKIIFSKNQILDWAIFKNASVHKTAQLILNAFGKDYADQTIKAAQDYQAAMKLGVFNIDKNSDAILDQSEKFIEQGFMSR